IARRVEQLYQRDGYLVPLIVPGDGDGATPHLHVFEARVAEVRVRGDAGAYRDAVAAVAARLEAQPVLHKAFTQRAIHELEDLPGLSVEAGFAPHDDDPNAFELTLDVGYERTDGLLSFSSRVSDDIGDGLLSARVGFNSAFGTGERLTLTAASSTTFGVYTYFGGRVERRFGLLDVDVSGSLADADIGTDSNYDAARLALELSTAMRRGSLVVRPLVALSMRNAEDHDDAGAAWEITRTRSIEAGVELTHRLETGVTQLRIGTERGI